MKRRAFSAFAATSLGSSWAWAQGNLPKSGRDYITLDKRAPTDAPAGKTEVVEFFWYSCPHCFAFEPSFEAWTKKAPKDVFIRRIPIAFREEFVPQQKLYFALEAMNRLGDMHGKVFQAIHVQKEKLNKDALVLAWAEKQGLSRAKFSEHYNSFNTSSKVSKAVQLQNAYRIEGVPSLGVAGRFYVDGTLAGSMQRALDVTDHLIGLSRQRA